MRIRTYSEIKTKILADIDGADETFVTFDEMVGYVNEGIDEAEAEILKLNEDYFLTSSNISVTSGTASYSLPSDIYGEKIRSLMYQNGSEFYEVKRLRRSDKFSEIYAVDTFGSGDDYQYYIKNTAFTDTTDSSTGGLRLILTPASRITSSSVFKLWYIRNAIRIPLSSEGSETTSNNTLVDIPEFYTFLVAFAKERFLSKEERGGPPHLAAVAELERQRKLMIDTLTELVPDNNTEVEQDQRIYWEHS